MTIRIASIRTKVHKTGASRGIRKRLPSRVGPTKDLMSGSVLLHRGKE